MTAKEYLRQIRLLDDKINQRMQEAEEIRQLAYGLKAVEIRQDAVQTSPTGDTMTARVGRYVDIEREIDGMIDYFVGLKHRIIGEIQELSDRRYVDILFMRYVQYRSFEEIAVEMHYAYKWVCDLHGQALAAFENLLRNHGGL